MDTDPKWLALIGLLQTSARMIDIVGGQMEQSTGVPPSWFEVLAQIEKGPKRMSDLAENLALSRGGATRLVARLEQAGLVEREIPAHDRRATFAKITPEGRAAFERALPVHVALVEQHFSRHITEAQAATLRTAFANVLTGNGVECGPATSEDALAAESSLSRDNIGA